MAVFCEEISNRARKGADRDGKRYRVTMQGQPRRCRACLKLSTCFVLVEEDLEVTAHVRLVEGVFGAG